MSSTTRGQRGLRGAITAGAVAIAACAMFASPAMAEDSSGSPSAPAPSAPAHSKSTFVIGLKQDIDTLNPYVGVLASSFDAYQMMYDYLTGAAPADMKIVPSLAKSWDTSADGKTWTFHLHEGVKWSDGQPLTADDVVYSYERVLQPDSTENGQYGSSIPTGTKVSASDPNTVVFQLPNASSTFLSSTQSGGVPIIPKHIWQNVSEKQVGTYPNDGGDGKPVVGSGPFILKTAKKGQYYQFTANPNYWNGRPHISELDMVIYQSEETMVQALEKGDIDFAQDLTAKAFNALKNKNEPDITLNSGASTYTYEVGFNTGAATVDNKPIGNGNAALKNPMVRQAIDYAIDKQQIVDKVLLGAGQVAYGEMNPLYAQWYWEPTGDEKRTFSPDKAKALLDQAGYKMGSNGYRVGPDGKDLTLRFVARSENQDSQDEAQYIQEWLKDIGIKVNVSVMSEDALTDTIGKGNYDMFQWDWSFGPDPDSTLSVFTCDSRSTEDGGAISAGWSDSFYCNPQFDALYKQQQTIIDPAQRKPVVEAALKNLYDNAMYSTLYYGKTLEAYRNDRFTGFIAQPSSGGAMVSQLGTWSYLSIQPYTGKVKAEDSNAPIMFGIGGGVLLVLIAGGVILATRRRSTADERE
jgi:peptide/nickel transport system substrate-binding protein